MTDRIDFGGRPWHAIPRDALRDERLSLKARGALVTLLSHDEGWIRSAIATLMREAKCGRDAAKAAMAELRETGYAFLVTERDLAGQLRRHYVISAEPRSSSPQTSESLGDGKPIGRETHRTGNPANEVEALDVDPLDVDPKPLASAPRPRPRDELFETLCELAGWDFHALTRAARGTVNDVAKQLRSVGATPEEARRRADTYRRVHPTWEFTIEALAKHWPGLNVVRRMSETELDEDFRRIAEESEARRQAQ